MLPVEICGFLTDTHHLRILWNFEFGEPWHCFHVVNKVEKTGTGIHRKGRAQFDICLSAFCKLWTIVHVGHAGLSHHRLPVENGGEYGESSSCTSIIWDLSFSHRGWITEAISNQVNLCLEYLLSGALSPLTYYKIPLSNLTRSSKKNQAYLKTDSLTMPVLTTICSASSSWKCYIIKIECWEWLLN